MQQKFIDHTDYDHLVSTLYEDFKPLFNKLKRIEHYLKSTRGTIKNMGIKHNEDIWISPKNKNIWTISYSTLIVDSKYYYSFYPFVEFQSKKGEKVFFLLNSVNKTRGLGLSSLSLQKKDNLKHKSDFGDFLSINNISLVTIRGHFIDQYRKRAEEKDRSIFDTMIEFGFDPQILIVDNYVQNAKWRMCLHSKGVAMLNVQKGYIIFETFVPTHELGKEQISAISEFLKDTHVAMYFLISLYLLRKSEVWVKFIDKYKLLESCDMLFQKNPVAINRILDTYELVNKLVKEQIEKVISDRNHDKSLK